MSVEAYELELPSSEYLHPLTHGSTIYYYAGTSVRVSILCKNESIGYLYVVLVDGAQSRVSFARVEVPCPRDEGHVEHSYSGELEWVVHDVLCERMGSIKDLALALAEEYRRVARDE